MARYETAEALKPPGNDDAIAAVEHLRAHHDAESAHPARPDERASTCSLE